MKYYYQQIALCSFSTSFFINFILNKLVIIQFSCIFNSPFNLYWIRLASYGISYWFIKTIYSSAFYEIAIRSCFLGFCLSFGVLISINAIQLWKIFGIYIVVLSIFHFTEFLGIAYTNPANLSFDSFVINHSPAYTLAAIVSWTEFIVEAYFFPEIKYNFWILVYGILICVAGEIFRKTAILTAKQNFNHIIQSKKEINHNLVTHGVYNMCRHPSYVGWFYWCIGTQIILHNPLCIVAYLLVSWKFFKDRIFIEELSLVNFFGKAYVNYQKTVGTGLPFITGYSVSNET